MDVRLMSAAFALMFAALCAVSSGMSIAHSDLKDSDVQVDGDKGDMEDSRPANWLQTRDLEDDFKDLIFLTMQELANEGRIDPRVMLAQTKTKRGRWQGFCFRRTASGRFLPYICWKGDRK